MPAMTRARGGGVIVACVALVLALAASSVPARAAAGTRGIATRGMVAAAGGLGTGPYGAPLVAGCAWATWVPQCQNLTAYGNGDLFSDSGCGAPNGCTFGPEFQCTELAQRYAHYAWGEPDQWNGYGGAQGSAYQMWAAAPALPIPLEQFAQGGGVLPQQGDLLVFAPGWLGSYWDANGHVAVVRDVASNYLDIVQQNGTSSGTDRFALSGSTVLANGYTPVIGWLHNPLMSATAAGRLDVAFSGQQELVFWKGGDGHLRESWQTGGVWSGQADWTLAWGGVAPLASAPDVLVTPDGSQVVFWRGVDGHLWQATYHSGWTGPVDLSAGWAVGQLPLSAPSAAMMPNGQEIVFWQASNGDLDEIWTSAGAWSPPRDWAAELGPGAVLNSSPSVAVTAGGAQVVFWQSLTGHLVSATYATSWSRPADVLSQWTAAGLVASAPTAAVTGGRVVVVWQSPDGHLWGAWYTTSWNGPSLWDGLGQAQSAPSAALSPSGQILVSWAGARGTLVGAYWQATWAGPVDWTSTWASAGLLGSAPAAMAAPGGQQVVFWRGVEGHLWEAWYTNQWNGPVDWTAQWSAAGPLASAPTVTVTPTGEQLVFWTGANGHLWEAWFDGAWHGPVDWSAQWRSGSALASAPSVTMSQSGQELLFWRGVEGDLWEAWFDHGAWNGPVDWSPALGRAHPLATGPTVSLAAGSDQQLVYWGDPAGHLVEAWFTSSWGGPVDWTPALAPGAAMSSPPAAAVTPANGQLIFWEGANAHLWESWWSGAMSTPVDWSTAGSGAQGMGSSPSAIALSSGQQVVFWRGPTGHLMETWWQGPWSAPVVAGGLGVLR